MTITAIGTLDLSTAIPGAALGASAGLTGINAALPDIEARLDALIAFAPAPIDFAAQLTLAQSIVTSIQAGIALGLTPPDISVQIAAVEALIAVLVAQASLANAQVTILLGLQATLTAGGVAAYAYDGTIANFGSELATALGGSGAHCNALVLLTTVPATWAAMGDVLKVTP